MIPAFLRSLAALVRQLVQSGQAVHVTEETARELELLAGLFEQHGPVMCALSKRSQGFVLPANTLLAGQEFGLRVAVGADGQTAEREVVPADMALGWLLSSSLLRWFDGDNDPVGESGIGHAYDQFARAAECAELAALAPWVDSLKPTASQIDQYLRRMGTGKAVLEDWKPTPMHLTGTRDGARAAWKLIVEQLEANKPTASVGEPGPLIRRGYVTKEDGDRVMQSAFEATWERFAGKYRRELEAMK